MFERISEESNPLPDSYIVAMEDLSLYGTTISEIQAIDGVDTISNRSEIAKKLTDVSNLVNIICFWVVIALVIISLFIIANTIRATMYSRRYEISIMKSVGATNGFVRLPFLVEGVIIGLISSIIGTGCIALLYNAGMNAIEQFIPFDSIPLSDVIILVAVAFLIAGVLIGFFGSFISIRKYLKMEGNEILGW